MKNSFCIARFFIKFFFYYSNVLELPLFIFHISLLISLLLLGFSNRGLIHRGTRSPKEFFGLFLFFLFYFTRNFVLGTFIFEPRNSILPNPAGDPPQPADTPPVLPDPAGDLAQPAGTPLVPPAVQQAPAISHPPQVSSIPSSQNQGRTTEDRVRDVAEEAGKGAGLLLVFFRMPLF